MLKSTIRSMIAHKLRLVLTTASISLGVAFLAGTLILTDTMGIAFEQLFGKVSAGTDAVVRTEASYTESEGIGTSRAPIDASVLDEVKDVDGVRVAEGSVSGYALITDNDGKAILTKGGAPTMGYSMAADETLRGDVELLSGDAPERSDEVVIDATSAEENDIELGSTIKVLFQAPTQEFTVVGTVGFGGEKDLGGTTSAYFDTDTAQRLSARPASSTRSTSARTRASARPSSLPTWTQIVPEGTEAVTGADGRRRRTPTPIKKDMKMVGILFMIFAGIALFVGGFIIWNTFTMIVTQRSREIALLRAIGATRRQVAAQPARRGGPARPRRLDPRPRPRPRRRQGPQGPDGPRRLQPAEHLAAGRAAHHPGVPARRHARDRRGRDRPGPARHQGAADRGAAGLHPRGGEAVEASCRHRPDPRCRRASPGSSPACTATRA